MVVTKDPLLEFVEGTGRKYFGLDQKYGTSIQEEIKLVGPPPAGTSKVGKLILNGILDEKRTQKGKLGSCWQVTLRRVEKAWKKAYGKSFVPQKGSEQWKIFEAIAGTRPGERPEAWKKAPVRLRKRGVPGAMAYVNAAKLVEGESVWKNLAPGAPLQLWDPPSPWGHAPIFYRYVHDLAGQVVAMVLADQFISFIILKRSGQSKKVHGAKFSYASSGGAPSTGVDTTSALGNVRFDQERRVCAHTQARIPGPVDETKIRSAQTQRHRGPIGMA